MKKQLYEDEIQQGDNTLTKGELFKGGWEREREKGREKEGKQDRWESDRNRDKEQTDKDKKIMMNLIKLWSGWKDFTVKQAHNLNNAGGFSRSTQVLQ